jgi:hypothetical protein
MSVVEFCRGAWLRGVVAFRDEGYPGSSEGEGSQKARQPKCGSRHNAGFKGFASDHSRFSCFSYPL